MEGIRAAWRSPLTLAERHRHFSGHRRGHRILLHYHPKSSPERYRRRNHRRSSSLEQEEHPRGAAEEEGNANQHKPWPPPADPLRGSPYECVHQVIISDLWFSRNMLKRRKQKIEQSWCQFINGCTLTFEGLLHIYRRGCEGSIGTGS